MSQTLVLPISAHIPPDNELDHGSLTPEKDEKRHSPLRGVIAGAIAGLIAGYVMNTFQSLATSLFESDETADKPNEEQGAQRQKKQPHAQKPNTPAQRRPATVIAADKLSRAIRGTSIRPTDEQTAGEIMHYLMAMSSGAIYGLIAEYSSAARSLQGATFGVALWATADEVAVPALSLSKAPTEYPLHVHLTSLAAHLVFGMSTEQIRKLLMKALQ